MMTKVNLMQREIRGIAYGVGRCVVRIGDASVDGIAVKADEERHISSDDGARDWLVQRGLSAQEAEDLLRSGLQAWDESHGIGIA